MLKEKVTVGEAVNLINDSIMSFADGLDSETINKIIYSVNNEIQIRDYLLGIPADFPINTCQAFLVYLAESVDDSERYSLETILAAYSYEANEIETAKTLINFALDTKPDYSLALLIKRVIEAGWPEGAFKSMREELHPKVISMLEEMQNQLI